MTWSKSQGPPGARAALFLKPVWMDTMVLKGWRIEKSLEDGCCIGSIVFLIHVHKCRGNRYRYIYTYIYTYAISYIYNIILYHKKWSLSIPPSEWLIFYPINKPFTPFRVRRVSQATPRPWATRVHRGPSTGSNCDLAGSDFPIENGHW